MKQPTHHQIATYLINYAISELIKYVIEDTSYELNVLGETTDETDDQGKADENND